MYFRVLKSEFMFYFLSFLLYFIFSAHSWFPRNDHSAAQLMILVCVNILIIETFETHLKKKKKKKCLSVFTVESKTTNLQLYISFYKMFCPVKKFHILLNVNALKPPQYSFITSNSVSFTLLSVDSLIPLEEFDLRPQ